MTKVRIAFWDISKRRIVYSDECFQTDCVVNTVETNLGGDRDNHLDGGGQGQLRLGSRERD